MKKNILIPALLTTTLMMAMTNTVMCNEAPSVLVKQENVVSRAVSETLLVYGRVEADPDAVLTVSLPHSGLVTRVAVRLGQRIKQGDTLLELSTSPAAHMQYTQALNAVNYAQRQLEREQRLLTEQLTTKSQLDAARKNLVDARSSLHSLKAQGQDKAIEIVTSPTEGIVTLLTVKQGDRVQANVAALAIASGHRLIARLGVEPEDIQFLKPGIPVKIHSVFIPEYQADSQLREIHAMINPTTHLVDVLAAIPANKTQQLVLGSYLSADLQLSKHQGLTVSREAVLQDDKGHYLFRVVDNKAQRVNVETGLENGDWVEITRGVKLNESIVSVGNYVLSDGMLVREEK